MVWVDAVITFSPRNSASCLSTRLRKRFWLWLQLQGYHSILFVSVGVLLLHPFGVNIVSTNSSLLKYRRLNFTSYPTMHHQSCFSKTTHRYNISFDDNSQQKMVGKNDRDVCSAFKVRLMLVVIPYHTKPIRSVADPNWLMRKEGRAVSKQIFAHQSGRCWVAFCLHCYIFICPVEGDPAHIPVY